MKKRVVKKKENHLHVDYDVIASAYESLIAAGRKEYFEKNMPKTEEEIYDYFLLIIGPESFYNLFRTMQEQKIESFTIEDLVEAAKRKKEREEKTKEELNKITQLENKKEKD
jgi:hypothetical protein